MALLVACGPNPNGLGVADFGTISGTVLDAKSQQPISTFTVQVGGQSVSVSPAQKGSFFVQHVPTGTQRLVIYAIGYQTYAQDGVVVQKDQDTPLGQVGIVSSTGL